LNVKVRQAAKYVIDREAIASGMGFGFLKAPYQIISTVDPDIALIRKVQNIVFDEAMVIPVYEGGKGFTLQNYVRGDVFLQTAFHTRLKPENVWMDK
jgi:ABC-type transport system substrate-binding protein